jgi:uncharacterized phage protein (TIGR02218 family)
MLQLTPAHVALMNNPVHRFALLWTITRTDGAVLRFTNHDSNIRWDGHNFTPAGSFSGSAQQRNDGFKDRNWTADGVINSDAITHEDLRAGRYRQAQITSELVDWRFPWAGPFETETFYIVSTKFSGEVWQAEIEGITHKLKIQVGRQYLRTCDVLNFADNRCGLVEADYTETAISVTGIVQPRRRFTTSLTPSAFADDWWKNGFLRWTSGANDNLRCSVAKSFDSGRIHLWIDTPFTIEIGDTFNIVAGCNRLFRTCVNKFNNAVNYRGFPTIPGPDVMYKVGRRPGRVED